MRSWALSAGLALWVLGGLVGAVLGLRNVQILARPAVRPAPVVAASAPRPPQPTPSPTAAPAELAPHPPLRDFDQSPPPFQPAGQVEVRAIAPTPEPQTTVS